MDLRHISGLQSVNGGGELFAQAFRFDLRDGIRIRMESKNQSARLGQTMESLAFTSEKRLCNQRYSLLSRKDGTYRR